MESTLKDLLQRVVSLEKDLEWYRSLIPWVIGMSGLILAGFFGLTWARLRHWIDTKLQSSAVSIAERKAKDAARDIEASAASIAQARKEADQRLADLRRVLEDIEAGTSAHFRAVETGQFQVILDNADYRTDRVPFSKRFSRPPVVLLGEHTAGNWVFLKVDESNSESFVWAAKPLSGQKLRYTTTVSWIAIAPV
jgi:hypothetical protein